MKPTLTIPEVAALLGRTERTIRRWIAAGLLRAVEMGGKGRRVCRAAVEALKAALEEGAEALTYREAAEVLRVSAATVKRRAAAGLLRRARCAGGRPGVCRRALLELLERAALGPEEARELAAQLRR